MTSINTSFSIGGEPVSQDLGSPAVAPTNAMASAPASAKPAIFDVTTATFMQDVIDASAEGPVVVDFWAPWCGPCKQLGPVIEKIITETGGAVRLAKMDIEQFPEVAGQMGIQSIPAVVAFVDGRPAEAFMGAKPESEVRAFIDKLAADAPKPAGAFDAATLLEAGNAMLADGDHGGAAEAFGTVAQNEPGNLDAIAGLGECYVAVGELDMARQLLETVPEEHREKPPIGPVAKSIELADQAENLGPLTDLEAKVAANEEDHQARLDYAVALNAAGREQEAVDQLITIVRKDREWNDDGARAQLLTFFESWGNADKATIYGRRALSSVLFS
jgi:putative thioredoxin